MGTSGRPSITKRQKEQVRQQRAREKAVKRQQRKVEKANRDPNDPNPDTDVELGAPGEASETTMVDVTRTGP